AAGNRRFAATEEVARHDGEAQLLGDLALERPPRILARLDLAAGKLPAAGVGNVGGAARRETAAAGSQNGRADHVENAVCLKISCRQRRRIGLPWTLSFHPAAAAKALIRDPRKRCRSAPKPFATCCAIFPPESPWSRSRCRKDGAA